MSSLKSSTIRVPDESATGRPTPAAVNPTDEPPARSTAPELRLEGDTGCDPYNRTGQFLVEHLKKFEA